jgi:type IV pilus assembly protein PilC
MAISGVITSNIVWVLLVAFATTVALKLWLRTDEARVTMHRLFLSVPYFGRLLRTYATSQFARTLAALLQGGLPLVNALEVASSSVANRAMALAISSATQDIREGKSLTTALESTGMVENLTLEMVKVGEQTGALGDMLNAVADFYDEELETSMAKVLSLVEPVLLVFMAIIVAGMLLAFYLPMFEAINAVERGF